MTTRHTPPLTYDEARTIASSQSGTWPQSVVDEANEVLDRELRAAIPNLWAPFDDEEEGDGSAWGLVFLLSAAFWLVLGAAFFLGVLW
jgi:hypothetical protein